MMNEEQNKTQNDAPFVAFYDMRAVTSVLPDEMADVSIVGLQWFILIFRLKDPNARDPIWFNSCHTITTVNNSEKEAF